jgi:uncharacterized protein YxjI
MQPRFIVEQKITAFTNKYHVYAANADGSKGDIVAFAQQKRIALREKITFYSDEQKTQEVFSFHAEKVLDVHGRYFVEDPHGRVIGMFRKNFAKSLINSTWYILDAKGESVLSISESNQILAIVRRFGGLIPIIGGIFELVTAFLRYHFVFKNVPSGEEVGSYQKIKLFRDHYRLSMTDQAYKQQDWRVLAAMGVALDALQSR